MTKMFGGADKSGAKMQKKFNNKLIDQIYEQAGLARNDITSLWPSSMNARASGTQGALDVLGGTIPQQLSAYQQGNVSAQQQLINGMGQYQNAIMGLPVNYGSFQPQQISYDPSFAQQQIPVGAGPDAGFDLGAMLGGQYSGSNYGGAPGKYRPVAPQRP